MITAKATVIDNTIYAKAEVWGGEFKQASFNISDSQPILYGGEYEYIPMVTSQILQCASKQMARNVTIYPIQTRERQDATGGVNFDILSGEVGDNGLQ